MDAVLAAALVAVTVPALGAWLGAHTGTAGTVVGTAIGAVLSVLTGWLVLRVSYHTRTGLAKVPWDRTQPWHYAAAALGVFAVGMAIVTGVEAGVLHKSLAASVTGSGGTGTTLGGVVGTRTAPDPVRPAATALRAAQDHPCVSDARAIDSGRDSGAPVVSRDRQPGPGPKHERPATGRGGKPSASPAAQEDHHEQHRDPSIEARRGSGPSRRDHGSIAAAASPRGHKKTAPRTRITAEVYGELHARGSDVHRRRLDHQGGQNEVDPCRPDVFAGRTAVPRTPHEQYRT